MALEEKLISDIRIELGDKNAEIWDNDELIRSIEKSVSLMSRLTPKREIIETTIVREITSEILTITNGTGTTTYKPIAPGTFSMSGKTLDTDYRINYLTGIVTEIGSGLPDTDYTISYELDPYMLDISTLLPDYIKLERMECPVGETPIQLVPFDVYGSFVVVRGTATTLDENEHARLIYLKRWSPPTPDEDGDYPSHLDDIVVIGAAGQALIFKAEKCVGSCVTNVDAVITKLAEIDDLSLTLNSLTAPTPPTLTFPDPPTAPTLSTLTPPTAPTLANVTVPTDYSFSKPSAPTLPTAPTAPSAPTLTFTDTETALDAAAATLADAFTDYLDVGDDLINAGTRGDNVGAVYGQYASVTKEIAGTYISEAIGRLRELEEDLQKYASEVTSYGSAVNAYANEVSGTIGKYREEINAEMAGINNFQAQLTKYKEQVDRESVNVDLYAQEVNSYEGEIAEDRLLIEKFQQEIANYSVQLNELSLEVGLYGDKVSNYQIEVSENQRIIEAYDAQVNALINYANQINNQVANYLSVAGRYLASGQAKINEFLTALGVKAEFVTSKGLQELRV